MLWGQFDFTTCAKEDDGETRQPAHEIGERSVAAKSHGPVGRLERPLQAPRRLERLGEPRPGVGVGRVEPDGALEVGAGRRGPA